MTRPVRAIRDLFAGLADHGINLPSMPGVFPDYAAPIVRNASGGRELVLARWSMPTPPQYLVGKRTDLGVTTTNSRR